MKPSPSETGTQSQSAIVIERHFDADCQTLYEAWTDPEVIAQWFFVDADWTAAIENDLRVGGRYELRMISDDIVHTMHGEYIELAPPHRVSFSWSSHVATDTRVSIELEARDGGTLLRLTHEFLPDVPAREAHTHGWHGCLDSLGRQLAARCG